MTVYLVTTVNDGFDICREQDKPIYIKTDDGFARIYPSGHYALLKKSKILATDIIKDFRKETI